MGSQKVQGTRKSSWSPRSQGTMKSANSKEVQGRRKSRACTKWLIVNGCLQQPTKPLCPLKSTPADISHQEGWGCFFASSLANFLCASWRSALLVHGSGGNSSCSYQSWPAVDPSLVLMLAQAAARPVEHLPHSLTFPELTPSHVLSSVFGHPTSPLSDGPESSSSSSSELASGRDITNNTNTNPHPWKILAGLGAQIFLRFSFSAGLKSQ